MVGGVCYFGGTRRVTVRHDNKTGKADAHVLHPFCRRSQNNPEECVTKFKDLLGPIETISYDIDIL
jgi:hypothetical protein